MDLGHKTRKNSSDNADLGCIMQLNVEGLSAAKHHIIHIREEGVAVKCCVPRQAERSLPVICI